MPFPVPIVLRLLAEHPGQETGEEKQAPSPTGSAHKHAAQVCRQSQYVEGHGPPHRDANSGVSAGRWLSIWLTAVVGLRALGRKGQEV